MGCRPPEPGCSFLLMLQRALALLPVAALCACGSAPTTTIEVRDHGLVPDARAIVALGAAQSAPDARFALELGVTGFSGSSNQAVGSGAPPVKLEGRTFTPPVELQNEFDFRYGEVAWRFRIFPEGGRLGLELLAGLGYGNLDVSVATPALRAAESYSAGALVAGGGMLVKLWPSAALHARFMYSEFLSTDIDNAQRFELMLAQQLGQNFGVRAGYAAWKVERERSTGSDVQVRFSGPALGIDLLF